MKCLIYIVSIDGSVLCIHMHGQTVAIFVQLQ